MNLAARFDVIKAGGLHERGAATGEVIQALLVLLQREAPQQDV